MTRLWAALRRWVITDPALPLEQQFFQALCLLGGVLSIFVVLPLNQFQGLNRRVDAVVLAFGLVSLALAWAARRGRYHRKTMLACLVACLNLIWFGNGGSQGSIGLYFFCAALFLVLFLEGGFRYAVLALLVADVVGLHLAERAWPGLVHEFKDPTGRLLDLASGYVLSILLCALMLWVVLEGFRREKEKLQGALQALHASEEKFFRIFEENPDALLLVDPALEQVLEANAGFERLFGHPRGACTGRRLQQLPIWADEAGCSRLQALAGSHMELHGLETAFRRRDGAPFWGDVSLAPVRFGGESQFLLAVRDVTDRYQAAQALAESDRTFRELLERQGEGFAVADEAERFLYANPVAEQVFGVPPGGLIGRSLLEFLDPPAQRTIAEQTRLREQNRQSTYELDLRRPDGSCRTILVTATPNRAKGDEPLRVIGVFRDITEEKRATEARRLLEQEQHHAQKMDSLGSLAGGVAHDFNNMLGGIVGYADLLLAEEHDPKRLEYLRAILMAASRSGELTRKLLAFGRRGKNLAESLDLAAIVADCLAVLRPAMGADLEVVVAMEGCPPVDGDPTQIHQVLMNLCINAVDAMPERGRLEITAARRELPQPADSGLALPAGTYAEVRVADTGVGIRESIRHRIFEPFFTTKEAGGSAGSGLGLATAYGIVQAHHGAITVESSEGRGSVFRVLLPAGTLPRPVRPALKDAPRGQGTVLLVEDEALLREAGTTILESLGYQVLAAADGEEAVAAFRDSHPRLRAVLLDLKMPRMAGREAFHEMRRINPEVPVIVCTGFGENEEVQRLLDQGAAGMLAKPYRIAELAAKLEGVIAG